MRVAINRILSWGARTRKVLYNGPRLRAVMRRTGLRVHLGCGDDHQPDFVNIDARATPAADVIMDLNRPTFSPSSVSFAFSNAFFEHLYRDSRLPHLRTIYESLQDDGVCCYIGLPYFKNVAKYYLERAPGTAGPIFDLFNVYRYTHGDPEQAPAWWLGQLHKSLFDDAELTNLLNAAGFGAFVVFCYGYPGDAHELPVTMGFYATKLSPPIAQVRKDCRAFLVRFADSRIRLSTFAWIGELANAVAAPGGP